jgi:hypothetical protein
LNGGQQGRADEEDGDERRFAFVGFGFHGVPFLMVG